MMNTVKKFISMRSFPVAVIALIIMVIAGVTYTGPANSGTGLWSGIIVGAVSRSILGVSSWLGNSYGLGIIVYTILIRLLILPLMANQTESMVKMQEIQPQLQALQKKYSSRDQESMMAMQAEQKALYKEANVSPFASFLPLLVQLPILMALYSAIQTTKILQQGTFLWVQLGDRDPYFILPILAAAFTFLSSYLVMMGQPEKNTMTTAMTFLMPLMIFFFAINVPSVLSLYWVVSNAFQVAQTWTLQNPFKLRAQRQAKKDAEKARERAIRKAKRSKKR